MFKTLRTARFFISVRRARKNKRWIGIDPANVFVNKRQQPRTEVNQELGAKNQVEPS